MSLIIGIRPCPAVRWRQLGDTLDSELPRELNAQSSAAARTAPVHIPSASERRCWCVMGQTAYPPAMMSPCRSSARNEQTRAGPLYRSTALLRGGPVRPLSNSSSLRPLSRSRHRPSGVDIASRSPLLSSFSNNGCQLDQEPSVTDAVFAPTPNRPRRRSTTSGRRHVSPCRLARDDTEEHRRAGCGYEEGHRDRRPPVSRRSFFVQLA